MNDKANIDHAKTLPENEAGYALLITITLISFLSIIMIAILNQSLQHAGFSKYYTSNVKAHYLAKAGINRLISALTSPADELLKSETNKSEISWLFNEKKIALKIEAESGKVDLNFGNYEHLKNLVEIVFTRKENADLFLSWIKKKRTQKEFIVGIPLPIFKDKETTSIDLNSVFTVYTQQTTVDPYSAPESVLRSIPGVSLGSLSSTSKLNLSSEILTGNGVQKYLGRKLPLYRLVVIVPDRAGGKYVYSVIVEISDGNRTVKILEEKQLIISDITK